MPRIVSAVRIASRRLWHVPGFTLTVLLTPCTRYRRDDRHFLGFLLSPVARLRFEIEQTHRL
jgi:hypothetical protein